MNSRLWLLAGAYACLIALGFAAWYIEPLHLGALAVIPLLIVSYYSRLVPTLIVALGSGIALALLDRGALGHPSIVTVSPGLDAVVLSAALVTVVFVARMLRDAGSQNAVLRTSLRQARREAHRDPLTGIANRAFFMKQVRRTIDEMHGKRVALLFCDLDGFKQVNDTAGHPVGDALLVLAAERLRNAIRSGDVIARIGGDEFAMIAPDVADVHETNHLIAQIEHAFDDPFASGGAQYRLGITVGASLYPDDGGDPETLLRISDTRMYRRKHLKRPPGGR